MGALAFVLCYERQTHSGSSSSSGCKIGVGRMGAVLPALFVNVEEEARNKSIVNVNCARAPACLPVLAAINPIIKKEIARHSGFNQFHTDRQHRKGGSK